MKNTALFIARRYLFAKKSTQAINVISAISGLGIMVGTAALIIILSAFNGLERLVLSKFNSFTPELLVLPAEGKTFDPNHLALESLKHSDKIYTFNPVLSEKALLWYGDKQVPALVRGYDQDILKNRALDSAMIDGSFILKYNTLNYAVLGSAVQMQLQVNLADAFEPLRIFSPKKGTSSLSINPMDDFIVEEIGVAGVFEIQQEFDQSVLVPIDFARQLFEEPIRVSEIELVFKPGVSIEREKEVLQKQLGNTFLVKNRMEQNQALYKVLFSEKWMIYLILSFVVIIAIFNIIGSLSMLVIEKQKDISVLNSLGAGKKLIKRIFLYEGLLISLLGCLLGLLIGLVFCLIQQHFGFIKMGDQSFVLNNAYPIAIKWQDFILVFITVSVFSILASAMAANLSVKNMDQLNQDL